MAYDGSSNVYFVTANDNVGEVFPGYVPGSSYLNVQKPDTAPDYSNSIFKIAEPVLGAPQGDSMNFWNCLPVYNDTPPCLPKANVYQSSYPVNFWKPSGTINEADLTSDWEVQDYDLGSSRPMLAGGGLITAGKSGHLVSVPNLSGTDVKAMKLLGDAMDTTGVNGCYNNFADWTDSTSKEWVYAWCAGSQLARAGVQDVFTASVKWPPPNGGSASLPQAQCPGNGGTFQLQCADGTLINASSGSNISISASPVRNPICAADSVHPNNPNCAILWATFRSGCGRGYGNFVAYDAVNLTVLRRYFLGSQLLDPSFNISECSDSDRGLNFVKFTPPVVANGRVYVPTAGDGSGNGWVLVYGITPNTSSIHK